MDSSNREDKHVKRPCQSSSKSSVLIWWHAQKNGEWDDIRDSSWTELEQSAHLHAAVKAQFNELAKCVALRSDSAGFVECCARQLWLRDSHSLQSCRVKLRLLQATDNWTCSLANRNSNDQECAKAKGASALPHSVHIRLFHRQTEPGKIITQVY